MRLLKAGCRSAFVLVLVLLLDSFNVTGQSTAETDQASIITEARKQLVAMCAPDGELFEFCRKNKISGDYVVDLTLVLKGEVVTVFFVSSTPENIQQQNFLKSKLTSLKFSNIKIPKKERIKFRHTLTLYTL